MLNVQRLEAERPWRESPVVYVVDDEEAVRDSLLLLLRSVGLTVRCYASPAEFLDDFDPQLTGCVVLDVRMPQMSGLALQEFLADEEHEIPIIFITGHGDVQMAVKAMRGGAVDFIEKPIHDQKLLDSIQSAIQQHGARLEKRAARKDLERRLASLTSRERDVLNMLMEGVPTKTVARQLSLSHRTVEGYRARIMEKTEVNSLTELVNLHRLAG
jgi:FixJ family two-component response regulator